MSKAWSGPRELPLDLRREHGGRCPQRRKECWWLWLRPYGDITGGRALPLGVTICRCRPGGRRPTQYTLGLCRLPVSPISGELDRIEDVEARLGHDRVPDLDGYRQLGGPDMAVPADQEAVGAKQLGQFQRAGV